MRRNDIGQAEQFMKIARAFNESRKVAIDQIRVVGNDALEHVARHVRHAFADPPEADDTER